MPKYAIEIKNSAIKELEKLQEKDYDKVSQLIFSLADNPRPSGCKKLKEFRLGDRAAYRVRIGKFRVIYTIEDDVLEVYIVKVGHRKDIYS